MVRSAISQELLLALLTIFFVCDHHIICIHAFTTGDGPAHLLRRDMQTREHVHHKVSHSISRSNNEARALGLLIIDYVYPTQPGDIDDKRSFCSTNGNYKCLDTFTIVKAKLNGLTFEKAQNNTWTDEIRIAFEAALYKLLKDPRVKAITGNCGFLAHYQSRADAYMTYLLEADSAIRRKPIRLSTLELIELLVDNTTQGGWSLQNPNEKVLVVTANKRSLDPNMEELMQKLDVDNLAHDRAAMQSIDDRLLQTIWTNITNEVGQSNLSQEVVGESQNISQDEIDLQRVLQLGAELTPGFGQEVALGHAHNVVEATLFMVDEVKRFIANASARNLPIKHILLECTEMPAYGNALRLATGLPVWDSVILAKCMMRSQMESPITENEDINSKPGFKACMLDEGTNLNTRFGQQGDNRTEGYSENGTAFNETVRSADQYTFNAVITSHT